MKVLYITNGVNGSGGLERVLSIKASYLADHYGYEIGILVLNNNHLNPFYDFSSKIHFFSIEVVGNPISYLNKYKIGIQHVVDSFQAQIISVCDDGLKGFFLPRIITTSAKWIYERHASIQLNTNQSFKGKIMQRIMFSQIANFSRFVVLTPSNIKEWNKKNVIAIPNPLSFQSNEINSLNNKVIITVGSHSWNKGYDLLINAWEQLEKKFPDWHLNIFGKIDNSQIFVNLSKEKKLNRINFHEPVKDIRSEYLKSSILVLPSRSEGFGMVLIEAMECGVPCVSFDCPSGPADIIKEGEVGFLVEKENVEELIEKMTILIEDEELRKAMGVNAKKYVKRYAPQEIVKQWDALFKQLLIEK
ncbi:MAG TPA: glycosyltransferase family 4 protein [Edaphocola sp.]|nr:glycosyltransferase family 4 protein [Edaphocola sp.]